MLTSKMTRAFVRRGRELWRSPTSHLCCSLRKLRSALQRGWRAVPPQRSQQHGGAGAGDEGFIPARAGARARASSCGRSWLFPKGSLWSFKLGSRQERRGRAAWCNGRNGSASRGARVDRNRTSRSSISVVRSPSCGLLPQARVCTIVRGWVRPHHLSDLLLSIFREGLAGSREIYHANRLTE
jgi:hypothetical protein